MDHIYDSAIIGGGPAGMTAGLYACRAKMDTVLIEKMLCGGQMLFTDTVENYPGFPEGIKGPDLANWMSKQAEHFGLLVKQSEATGVSISPNKENFFLVKLESGEEIKALSLIVSTGAKWNPLNVPGEKELVGRGVSYCGTCDGPLFRGKEVIVVGGGDTALEEALFLTKFAKKVTVVHRRDALRGTRILQERAFANKAIEFCFNHIVLKITGTQKVDGVVVSDVITKKESKISADGVFIFIGMTPNTELLKDMVKTDERGYILTDDDMKTSVQGVFACGDVRKKLLRQVITASGDGATAAFSAQGYVDRLKGVEYK